MSRIEELPDDFNEGLDLNALTEGQSVAELEESYAKRFPKAQASEKPKQSFEEMMSDISKTPLFMNSLDEAGDADGENPLLDAIRALQYEGTKAEIAQGFKDQGNEMVKAKMWKDAKEFYNKGIAVLTAEKDDEKWGKGEDPEVEKEKEKQLEEQTYVNRALCNLELGNFRSTTLDCAAALRLNPSNVKAYYRSASALLSLDKILEAKDACYRGIQIEATNVALKKLMEKIESREKLQAARNQKVEAERKRKRLEEATREIALDARNIVRRWSDKSPDLDDSGIHLTPDPLSPKSMLVFPVIFLYPMHAQSDFIKAFAEKTAIIDHLSYLIPLPWDTKSEYKLNSVECYMDTPSGGMVKVGKKLSLLQALANGKTVVNDGLVKIHVVPTQLAPKWIEELKRRKNA